MNIKSLIIVIIYLILAVFGIPWYWPKNNTTLWAGMPLWVVVAILSSVLVSLLTAWILRKSWDTPKPDPKKPNRL